MLPLAVMVIVKVNYHPVMEPIKTMRALSGAVDSLAIDNLNDFGFDQGILDSGFPQVLTYLFQSPVPFFGPAGAALTAMEELQAADLASITPANNAMYPDSVLGNKMRQAGQLIKSELPV